jgi:hypothetical protein
VLTQEFMNNVAKARGGFSIVLRYVACH